MKETKKKKPFNLQIWTAIILGVICCIIVPIQVGIGISRQLSPLETILFSILQFIFSIGFAWISAKITSKADFIRSQKQFAIAAFRRIKEIDITVERVLNRVKLQMKTADANTHKELDVILEISRGIRQSIKSSIADWSDIIGEEIATIEKIEILTLEEEIITDKIKTKNISSNEENQNILKELEKKQDEVMKLIATLPPALQTETKKGRVKNASFEQAMNLLQKELKENNFIKLNGFWDKSFEKDIWEFKEGDKLTVKQGDVARRIGAMIAYDNDKKAIGVMTNDKFDFLSYSEYYDLLFSVVGKSSFQVEIISIRKESSIGDRHYFTTKII